VQLVATGVGTPTSFAFGAGKVFEGDAGNDATKAPGGVFVLRNGVPVRLSGPPVVFGLAFHKDTLYVASGASLLAWSKWNGVDFAKKRTIYTGPKNFPGFNGIAFGPDGRLYVGVDVGQTNDHGPATARSQYDILVVQAQRHGPQGVRPGHPPAVADGVPRRLLEAACHRPGPGRGRGEPARLRLEGSPGRQPRLPQVQLDGQQQVPRLHETV
jgi:hypothetical protein